MNTPPTLDRFETALLQELRAHVAERPAPDAPTPATRRPRRTRRLAVGLVAAAATATAAVVVSPGGPAVSPAYAVVEQPDGDIVVTIHRLDDAAGLETALREHGIDAEVDFDPDQFDVGHEVEGEGWRMYRYLVEMPSEVPDRLPLDGPCDEPDSVFRFDEVGTDYVLTIPADSLLLDQSVLYLTTAGEKDGEGYGLTARYLVDGHECGFASYGFGLD